MYEGKYIHDRMHHLYLSSLQCWSADEHWHGLAGGKGGGGAHRPGRSQQCPSSTKCERASGTSSSAGLSRPALSSLTEKPRRGKQILRCFTLALCVQTCTRVCVCVCVCVQATGNGNSWQVFPVLASEWRTVKLRPAVFLPLPAAAAWEPERRRLLA